MATAGLVSSRSLVTSNLRLRNPTPMSPPAQNPVRKSCASAVGAASANARRKSMLLMPLILKQTGPFLAPLERGFFRQDAARRVVLVALADALGAELGEHFVEFLAAEIERFGVGAVAQSEHAVADLRQVRSLRLQVLVKLARVVRHVALAVGRGADQEGAVARKDGNVEVVHQQRFDLRLAVVDRELHLLGAKLRRAGHGADQDVDLH